MKYLKILIILTIIICHFNINVASKELNKKQNKYLYDNINVLEKKDYQEINDTLSKISELKRFNIYVYITDKIVGKSVEQDSNMKANELMRSTEYSAATLFYIAIADRKMKIEVGNGALFELSDNTCKDILNKMLPKLKTTDYKGAILIYINEINNIIKNYSWVIDKEDFRVTGLININKIFEIVPEKIDLEEDHLYVYYKNTQILLKYSKYQDMMIRNYFISKKSAKELILTSKFRLYFRLIKVENKELYMGNLVGLYEQR